MDGQQLGQWLAVQAGDMAGALQHGVRALISRTRSPEVTGQADELARVREQLRRQRQSNLEMKHMLQKTSGSSLDKKHKALCSAHGTVQKTSFAVKSLQ